MADSLSHLWEEAARLEAAREPHVLVLLTAIRGSAPQEVGARMLVPATGEILGTVGGGKLEAAAIRKARELLADEEKQGTSLIEEEWNLQRDIGMTCGGAVRLLWELRNANPWTIAIFGAGHIVQSLVPILLPLPATILCADTRPDWIERLPRAPNLRTSLTDDLPALVPGLPHSAFVLCITQGHATDLPILAAALQVDRSSAFPFLGCIGSEAKAARLRGDLRGLGIGEEKIAGLRCPLGLALGGNHPREIAISIAAQLLQCRDELDRGPKKIPHGAGEAGRTEQTA